MFHFWLFLSRMPQNMKQKLCYVIPNYQANDDTHFFHIHDFLKRVSGDFELTLIALDGSLPEESLGAHNVYLIRSNNIFLRIIEIKFRLLQVMFSGCRNFYVHYSFLAALISSCITRFFGGRTFYWNCGEPWKYSRPLGREIFERVTYKLVNFVVTGAELLADKYAEVYNLPRKKIKVMPNWIDLKRFNLPKNETATREALKISAGRKIVLFIHHLSKRKGSDMILPVAREVSKLYPDVYFIVVGDGPDYERLLGALKNDPSLSRFVRLEGAIPNSLVPKYLSLADVFFMPSEEEGFPRVLLEAMAMGVPFVVSDVGAVKEIVPASMKSYVINYGNTDLFAEKLSELIMKNLAEQKIISAELTETVAGYDVNIVAGRFREMFFNSLI